MVNFVESVNEKNMRPPARSVAYVNAGASYLYDLAGNRKYLTPSERAAFLTAAEHRSATQQTFLRTLAFTGARLSEVLALTPRSIDLAAGVIVIESLKKRRRGVYRAVPVPASLLDQLDRTHLIFQAHIDAARCIERLWPWCRTTGWHHVKACMEEAGIQGRQAMPRGLRHGFGVGVLQAGVPINMLKKWLGHSRLSTTEIYTEAVGAEEQAIAGRFWRTF